VPLSQHFKPPKRTSSNGSGPKRRKPQGGTPPAPETPPPASASSLDKAKSAYVELLLKKADSEDQMDSGLLDRIERVIGFGEGKTSSPGSSGGDDDS
jgi:hypothetical protein